MAAGGSIRILCEANGKNKTSINDYAAVKHESVNGKNVAWAARLRTEDPTRRVAGR